MLSALISPHSRSSKRYAKMCFALSFAGHASHSVGWTYCLASLKVPSRSKENKMVQLKASVGQWSKLGLSSRAAAMCWPILYLMMILLQLCASSMLQKSSRFTYLK